MDWDFVNRNRRIFARFALLSLALFFLLLASYQNAGIYTQEDYQQMQIIRSQQPGTALLTGHKKEAVPLRPWLDTGAAGLPVVICLPALFFCFFKPGKARRLSGAPLTLVSLFDRLND